ncbi:solute carrier family 22 member 6-like isoform X1 [Panulirus ornatus]|uniref:solute carrier family 22 member 6-like isoform X1 n=1 Tax=Panulirus ornatus TaxID=150431 RepID=UPI003A83B56C
MVRDNLDDVMEQVGWGLWQAPIVVFIIIAQSSGPGQWMGVSLYGAPLPFKCSSGGYFITSTANATINSETGYWWSEAHNQSDVDGGYDNRCLSEVDQQSSQPLIEVVPVSQADQQRPPLLYINPPGPPSCPVVHYDTSVFENSIISEWHMVCERESLRPLFQMVYTCGNILGCFICGLLGDRLGRKRTLLLGTLISLPSIMVIVFLPWYSVVLAARFATGIANLIIYFASYTLFVESIPPRNRSTFSILINIMQSVAIICFGAVGYMVRSWRRLLLVSSVQICIAPPLILLLKESPRWLIQKGRWEEAISVLEKAAILNRSDQSAFQASLAKLQMNDIRNMASGDEVTTEKQEDQTLWQALKFPVMRAIILVTPAVCFQSRVSHMGITLNSNNFTSTSPFQYVIVLGAMGMAANLFGAAMSVRVGRRAFVACALLMSGSLLALDTFIPSDYGWVKWVLIALAFFPMSSIFQTITFFMTELFPTAIRVRGMTLVEIAGGVGDLCAPLITHILALHAKWAISIILGGAGILGGLLALLLPETRNRPLPETIHDVENRGGSIEKSSTIQKCSASFQGRTKEEKQQSGE